jgi:hypothetical protein
MNNMTVDGLAKVDTRRRHKRNQNLKADHSFLPIFGILLTLLVFLSSMLFFFYQHSQPQGTPSKENITTSTLRPEATATAQPTVPWRSMDVPEEIILEQWEFYESKRFGSKFINPGGYVLETTYEDIYLDQGHIRLYDQETYEAMIANAAVPEAVPLIQISAFKNPDQLSVLEWVKDNAARSNFGRLNSGGAYDTRQVAGQEAITYSWEGLGSGYTVALSKENYEYIVILTLLDPRSETLQDFERLVSTFQLPE